MPNLAAGLVDDRGCIALQRVTEGDVVGDEEPRVAAALDDLLRGADRERARVEHPLHRVGRAELAVEIRRAGRMRDEHPFLFVGNVLDRKADSRYRHVDDEIDLLDVIPAPRDGSADIGLELMIADNDADGLAKHASPEIIDGHLRRRHRALTRRRRGGTVHVGEHADLDGVVGDLG